jgi:hypothetical protein
MTRTLQLVVLTGALVAIARAQDAPRNDLPQPYRTTRDWGELPAGVKWAAVTAVEPAPDGTICRATSTARSSGVRCSSGT